MMSSPVVVRRMAKRWRFLSSLSGNSQASLLSMEGGEASSVDEAFNGADS